jgi:Tetracyclin repressor-like, C-terminal domain
MLALLRRGVERGEVRLGADVTLVADVLPSVLTYRMILQREPVNARMINEIIDQVLIPLISPR